MALKDEEVLVLTQKIVRRLCTMYRVEDQYRDDIISFVMMKFITAPPAPEAAKRWIWVVATRKIMEAYRRRGTKKFVPVEDIMLTQATKTEKPESNLHAEELFSELTVNTSSQVKDILRRYFFDNQTTKEIGHELSVPEGTVKCLIHRRLASIRAQRKGFGAHP